MNTAEGCIAYCCSGPSIVQQATARTACKESQPEAENHGETCFSDQQPLLDSGQDSIRSFDTLVKIFIILYSVTSILKQ